MDLPTLPPPPPSAADLPVWRAQFDFVVTQRAAILSDANTAALVAQTAALNLTREAAQASTAALLQATEGVSEEFVLSLLDKVAAFVGGRSGN